MSSAQSSQVSAEDRRGQVDVELDESSHVATVSFSRGRNNYLTYELIEQLLEELEDLRPPSTRAIVLRSVAHHFSAGADFGGERPSQAAGPHVFDLVPRLYSLEVPVVAAIGGAAIGAGLGLALAADFRLATPAAYFLTNFNRIGLTPGFGLSFTLPRMVGSQRAAEMFYTARRVGAEEAFGFGLCDRVVEPERLDDAAASLATNIALSSPRAVAGTRRALRAGLVEGLKETLKVERGDQSALIDTDDFREGVQAWRDKRAPNFVLF